MAISQNSKILAKDIRDKLRVNYLSPVSRNTTSSGVTCRKNNSEGYFILNGTATGEAVFYLAGAPNVSDWLHLEFPKSVKFVAIDKIAADQYAADLEVSAYSPDTSGSSDEDIPHRDQGDGIEIPAGIEIEYVALSIRTGTQLNNLVLKPMITDDLEAVYDDFVPYNRSLAVNNLVAQKSDVLSLADIQANTHLTGKIASASALKAVSTCYVVEQGRDKVYINNADGTNVSHERWWRKWSDGRIEQGGYVGRDNISLGSIPKITVVTMKLSFQSRLTYYVTCNLSYNASGDVTTLPSGGHTISSLYLYPDNFTVGTFYGNDSRVTYVDRPFVWTATGY